jgi:hypothetical protein
MKKAMVFASVLSTVSALEACLLGFDRVRRRLGWRVPFQGGEQHLESPSHRAVWKSENEMRV